MKHRTSQKKLRQPATKAALITKPDGWQKQFDEKEDRMVENNYLQFIGRSSTSITKTYSV